MFFLSFSQPGNSFQISGRKQWKIEISFRTFVGPICRVCSVPSLQVFFMFHLYLFWRISVDLRDTLSLFLHSFIDNRVQVAPKAYKLSLSSLNESQEQQDICKSSVHLENCLLCFFIFVRFFAFDTSYVVRSTLSSPSSSSTSFVIIGADRRLKNRNFFSHKFVTFSGTRGSTF